jgi:hypothetical protein
MNVASTLDAAADYIEKHGWAQGTMRTDDGRVCASGGICLAANRGEDAWLAALNALEQFVGEYIPRWNDRPERTAAEVTSAMRAVACTERAREIRAEVALAHEQIRVIA